MASYGETAVIEPDGTIDCNGSIVSVRSTQKPDTH